ncbi:amidohydrolase family protein [Streptosporangium sp. NPDC004631]
MTTICAIVGAEIVRHDGSVERADVVLHDDRVARITAAADTGGATVVEAYGMTVLPGLVDAHVHLSLAGHAALPKTLPELTTRAAANLAALLESGVTAARDVGGHDGVAVALSRAVERGWLPGPAVWAANRILCVSGGHGSTVAGVGLESDGPGQMRAAVRAQARSGARLVKIAINSGRNRVEVTHGEMAAVVDEAHRLGLRVACHASVPDAVELAVECGVDTVEHGNGARPEHLRAMAAAGTVLVPTAWAFRRGLQAAGRALAEAAGGRAEEAIRAAWQGRVDAHTDTVAAAVAAGVRIAVGTDATVGQPVTWYAKELETLVELGLSPAQAVVAATAGGSAALAEPDVGRLYEGGPADLVVVDRPAGEVLAGVGRPLMVIRAGRVVVDNRAAREAAGAGQGGVR